MTLKEIYKIIDESDTFLFKDGDRKCFLPLNSQDAKDSEKGIVDHYVKKGYSYIFYKHDDKGGVEKSWIVDHIDKEKKIVKKKLDDMTEQEIIILANTFCHKLTCATCPLSSQDGYCISNSFITDKEHYLENKDKEFEIEVEE